MCGEGGAAESLLLTEGLCSLARAALSESVSFGEGEEFIEVEGLDCEGAGEGPGAEMTLPLAALLLLIEPALFLSIGGLDEEESDCAAVSGAGAVADTLGEGCRTMPLNISSEAKEYSGSFQSEFLACKFEKKTFDVLGSLCSCQTNLVVF